VSNPDSFIDEVNEELKRDRLFAMMRKYGWIVVVAVIAVVGFAAWNEWSKSQAEARAQALGDAIVEALEDPDAAASAAPHCRCWPKSRPAPAAPRTSAWRS
jgi:hypothetical protein